MDFNRFVAAFIINDHVIRIRITSVIYSFKRFTIYRAIYISFSTVVRRCCPARLRNPAVQAVGLRASPDGAGLAWSLPSPGILFDGNTTVYAGRQTDGITIKFFYQNRTRNSTFDSQRGYLNLDTFKIIAGSGIAIGNAIAAAIYRRPSTRKPVRTATISVVPKGSLRRVIE